MNDEMVTEQKVRDMVVNEGRTLKNCLDLGELAHYISRGPHRNDYNRLRREIEAEKNEKKRTINAKKCKWFCLQIQC